MINKTKHNYIKNKRPSAEKWIKARTGKIWNRKQLQKLSVPQLKNRKTKNDSLTSLRLRELELTNLVVGVERLTV